MNKKSSKYLEDHTYTACGMGCGEASTSYGIAKYCKSCCESACADPSQFVRTSPLAPCTLTMFKVILLKRLPTSMLNVQSKAGAQFSRPKKACEEF